MHTSNFKRNPKLFHENTYFASKVNDAVKIVKAILDNTRNPTLASPNHKHSYNDKFTLSESVTNTAVASFLNVLDKMGMESYEEGSSSLLKLICLAQDDKKSVTMRFIARETCSFVCEKEIEIESPHRVVEESSISSPTTTGNIMSQVLSRVVKTKVKEYHWKVEIEHGIYLHSGNETEPSDTNSVLILNNKVSSDLVTRTSEQPFKPSVDIDPLDVSLTWLLRILNKDTLQSDFKIDRESAACRTPRSNDDIMHAWEFFTNLNQWCVRVGDYFKMKDKQLIDKDKLDISPLSLIGVGGIFVPVLPLFETLSEEDGNKPPIISYEDVNLFLNKQVSTIKESIESLHKNFSGQIMSPIEATIVLLTNHASSIAEYYFSSVNHIEDMLCTQLYNAIGKHVSNDDLDDFVRSYNQKLFADTYAPESFCYAVRRPGHYPDGMISIEECKTNGKDKGAERNALTFTRQLETSGGENTMYIPINSATNVQFNGNMFLHAWMMNRFQHDRPSFQLASRARQFSSFLLLVGKLSGPNTFEPEHGIILQNQDEVLIPLLLEEMPSAKEFKDAIVSLSPEQQRFAKAFRNMKLASSVFGVCVVQLKPQLEMLLGLPEKSLTKEIRLTQSLLSLFIDYQIPSDLLSFDGDNSLDAASKLEVVKGHVKNVEAMIDDIKDRDFKKARLEADMTYELASMKEAEEGPCVFGAASPLGSYVPNPTYAMEMKRRSRDCMELTSIPTCAFGATTQHRQLQKQQQQQQQHNHHQIENRDRRMTRRKSNQQLSDGNTSRSSNIDNNDLISDVDSNKITDLTTIPKLLDSKFEMFGDDEKYGGALRSTTIKSGECWTKKRKQNILSKLESITLTSDNQKTERQKAFDLLDALSRSGILPMSHAELHVVIASTHCFDKSVVNTVVQDNVNPIEKIERSHLLVASIIHNVGLKDLLSNEGELDRIRNHSPLLMIEKDSD